MSKDYSVNLEEELQEALQDAVDGYLEGRDAINEGEFGDFIKGKLGEFALKYAADNSEDILNAIFGEDNVKKSRIPASKIADAYELGDKINEGRTIRSSQTFEYGSMLITMAFPNPTNLKRLTNWV